MIIRGYRLKELRTEKGFASQLELEKASGVDRSLISLIESGERTSVQMSTIDNLASALKMDASELYKELSTEVPVTNNKIDLTNVTNSSSIPSHNILNELRSITDKISNQLERDGRVEVPCKGYVNAGLLPPAERLPDYLKTPKSWLGDEPMCYEVYRVSGNEMASDGIFDKDAVYVKQFKEFIDNKFYLLEWCSEFIISKVNRDNEDALFLVHGRPAKCPFQKMVFKGIVEIVTHIKKLNSDNRFD